MYVNVDGEKVPFAVAWGVDEAGCLDLYSQNDKVMKTLAPGTWTSVERVLEDDESWETYPAEVPSPNEALGSSENILQGAPEA